MRQRHIGFIRQAPMILQQRGHDCGFRWQCDTFRAVEQFLCEAANRERELFAEAVRAGAIGLSASYANFAELLDFEVLSELTARAVRHCGKD